MTSLSASKPTKEVYMNIAQKTCKISDCQSVGRKNSKTGRHYLQLGLCNAHYIRFKRYGDSMGGGEFRNRDHDSKCSVASCESKYYGVGYCNKHYQNKVRNNGVIRKSRNDKRTVITDGDLCYIPLGSKTKDSYAIVDKQHERLVANYNWTKGKNGYAIHRSTNTYLHHLILGKPDKGECVDHINRDKLDNRVSNLRFATYSLNSANTLMRASNTSGYKGVYRQHGKWCSRISYNKKHYWLGRFESLIDAANAYNEKALELLGRDAVLNEIP